MAAKLVHYMPDNSTHFRLTKHRAVLLAVSIYCMGATKKFKVNPCSKYFFEFVAHVLFVFVPLSLFVDIRL